MTNRTWLVLPLIAVALSAAAPRVANNRWIVNFADAQCLAERDYGTPAAPLRVILKQPPLGDVIQLAIVQGKGGESSAPSAGSVKFDGMPPLNLSVLKFEPQAAKADTYLFNIPAKDFQQAKGARLVSVSANGMREELALSNVAPVLKLMEECVTDLRTVFNIDAAGHQSAPGIRPPDGSLSGMFGLTDFADGELSNASGGTVDVLLLIDEKGSVADCAIIGSTRSVSLDGQTCAFAQTKAKFRPAKGADGNPAKGAVRQRVTWEIQ